MASRTPAHSGLRNSCHITDGSEGTQKGEDGYGSNPTSHSGRAAQIREPIPEENRKGLEICKCSAQGAEENRVRDDQGGTPVHENALQYGNINKPSEDCNASPRPNSCDVLDNSIATALDTSKATHFRCLIESEVDEDLRLQAASMGIDVANFSPTNFQENRELLLNRVTSRAALGLNPNATEADVLAKQESDRQIRVKYQDELGENFANASEAELNEAKLTRRSYYRQAFNISEEDLDEAIQAWNDIRDEYGLEHSATPGELEEAMREREAEEAVILRARYGLGPEATQEELDAAIQAYEDIRRQYNLPIDADDETLQAAIRDASLYEFTSHTFTNCNKTGFAGPTLADCINAKGGGSGNWYNDTDIFNVIGEPDVNGIQLWTVPTSGNYTIIAKGAAEGYSGRSSGFGAGAVVQSTFTLTKGDKYMILVGQKGTRGNSSGGWQSAGGGGGTFMVKGEVPDDATLDDVLIVAGGGGGSVNAGGNSTSDPGQDGGNTNSNDTSGGSRSGSANGAGAGGGLIGNGQGWVTSYGSAFVEGGKGANAFSPTVWGSATCIAARDALAGLGNDNLQYNAIVAGSVEGVGNHGLQGNNARLCHGAGHGGFGGGGGGGGNPGGGGGGIHGGDYGRTPTVNGYNVGGRGGGSHVNSSGSNTVFSTSNLNDGHGSLRITKVS